MLAAASAASAAAAARQRLCGERWSRAAHDGDAAARLGEGEGAVPPAGVGHPGRASYLGGMHASPAQVGLSCRPRVLPLPPPPLPPPMQGHGRQRGVQGGSAGAARRDAAQPAGGGGLPGTERAQGHAGWVGARWPGWGREGGRGSGREAFLAQNGHKATPVGCALCCWGQWIGCMERVRGGVVRGTGGGPGEGGVAGPGLPPAARRRGLPGPGRHPGAGAGTQASRPGRVPTAPHSLHSC